MNHTVDTHPQKKFIIDALLKGQPLRSIAATLDPPLHFTSLQRYKKSIVRPALRRAVTVAKVTEQVNANTKSMERHGIHDVPESVAVVALHEAKEAIQYAEITDPYLARIRQHQATIDAAISFACDREDPKSVAALVATDYKGIELDARLTGRLDARNTDPTLNLAVMVQIPRAVSPRQVVATDVEFREIEPAE